MDNNGATAWDYARGRQLHYCMLIIASYIRQRAKDRGEEVDMGTLANMTFAGKQPFRMGPSIWVTIDKVKEDKSSFNFYTANVEHLSTSS